MTMSGGRLYFDGSALIAVNGEVIKLGPQFGLRDVEVLTASVDINSTRSFRSRLASLRSQVRHSNSINLIFKYADCRLQYFIQFLNCSFSISICFRPHLQRNIINVFQLISLWRLTAAMKRFRYLW